MIEYFFTDRQLEKARRRNAGSAHQRTALVREGEHALCVTRLNNELEAVRGQLRHGEILLRRDILLSSQEVADLKLQVADWKQRFEFMTQIANDATAALLEVAPETPEDAPGSICDPELVVYLGPFDEKLVDGVECAADILERGHTYSIEAFEHRAMYTVLKLEGIRGRFLQELFVVA